MAGAVGAVRGEPHTLARELASVSRACRAHPVRQLLQQVYLVTASHADQLSAHLKQAGWASGRGGMAVHVMAAHSCQTEGEALRFVEEQDVIKGDFLLVGGAMAANVDLRPALQAHMARRAANRQAIMTIVLHSRTTRSAAAAAAPSDDGCLAVVDPSNQQLLRMEQRMHVGHAALGTHLLGERNCIAVRFAWQSRVASPFSNMMLSCRQPAATPSPCSCTPQLCPAGCAGAG